MIIEKIQLITTGATDAPDVVHAEFLIRGISRNDRYLLKGTTGLDVQDVSQVDAGYYVNPFPPNIVSNFNDTVLKDRVITLSLGLNPDYKENQEVGQLRDLLYKIIAYSRQKDLQICFFFKTPTGVSQASLYGSIVKMESDLYTNDPDIKITIDCDDPYFRSPSYVVLDDVDHWGGDGHESEPVWTDALSTAPHGFNFQFYFTEAADHFYLMNSDYEAFIIDHSFAQYDTLIMSSEYKMKDVFIVSGTPVHLMDKIRAGSIWPVMFPGENSFKAHNLFESSPGIFQEISYRHAYWGV